MTAFETTFDSAALDYEKSRPAYMPEIYAEILRYAPIGPESDVLEIGVGTGKATQPILDTHCRFVGIEPGTRLADLARERFQAYPNFTLLNQAFQDFACADNSFDLIFAATAFHWIPEEYGYAKVFRLLKPGGAFARFAYHAGPDQGRSALTEEIRALYRQFMHAGSPPAVFGEADAKKLAEKALSYGFVDAKDALSRMTKDFTAEEYMALLRTYPDHRKLDAPDRDGLLDGIASAIRRHGGVLTVYYTMDLELARKPFGKCACGGSSK